VSLDQWFVVGVIRERGANGNLIATLGDPAQPFYAGAASLVAPGPYPRDLSVARQGPLLSVMNAVVYLGPEPDRSMSHSGDLTAAQQADLGRHNQIKGDLRQLMQLRYGHGDDWFRTHPDDIPRSRDVIECCSRDTSLVRVQRCYGVRPPAVLRRSVRAVAQVTARRRRLPRR
jgi:hypothetical protein